MITQSELIAALKAIGIDAEVQATLEGIPLPVLGVHFDEHRALIRLALDDDRSREAKRRFIAGLSDGSHAVRHNARGHFEFLPQHRGE